MTTTTSAATRSNPAATIRLAASPADFEAGRNLAAEYLEWLEATSAIPTADAQPHAAEELANFAEWYAPPSGRLLLADLGGRAVGVAGLHTRDDRVAELKRVYVGSAGRGHRLGEQLVRAAIDEARDIGARAIWLTTLPPVMAQAVAIYRSLGFRERPLFEGFGVADLVAMELTLE